MKVNYSSNNSGGRWWLSDEDWFALEKAGWTIIWKANEPPLMFDGKEIKIGMSEDGTRYMGALAKEAFKEFETPGAAMREFEAITGQYVSDEGCNCCGAPHCFNWGEGEKYGSAYGEGCLEYMYKKVPKSLRDSCEEELD